MSGFTCPVWFISLFNDEQVREYLLKRFPNPWHYGLTRKQDVRLLKAEKLLRTMKSLKFRPLLLAHIEDLLDSEQQNWNSYSVYQAMVSAWLQREVTKIVRSSPDLKPTVEQLWQACQVLAMYLQMRRTRQISESELRPLICRLPPMQQLDKFDFGGRSLLNRDSERGFRFAHYSIQEFLVVHALANGELETALQSAAFDAQIHKPIATKQMVEFLVEALEPHTKKAEILSLFDWRNALPCTVPYLISSGKIMFDMVWLPPGTLCGKSGNVSIDKPYALGRYPVTFDEYDSFCKATGKKLLNDENWGRGRRPVINVSWDDAQAYCNWLSGQTGARFRLPTEAEWEYSCRAGSKTIFFGGNDESIAGYHAWFIENSHGRTQPVGQKRPNAWGLYDISGNVCEWTADKYDADSSARVLRGGSWSSDAGGLRSALRFGDYADGRDDAVGFRLAQDLP